MLRQLGQQLRRVGLSYNSAALKRPQTTAIVTTVVKTSAADAFAQLVGACSGFQASCMGHGRAQPMHVPTVTMAVKASAAECSWRSGITDVQLGPRCQAGQPLCKSLAAVMTRRDHK